MIDGYNSGDYEAGLEHAHPEIEIVRVGGLPALKGREAAITWMKPDALEEQHLDAREFIVNGNRVYVEGTFHGKGAGSGIEMTTETYSVWTFEDGLLVRSETFLERAPGRAAAGLD